MLRVTWINTDPLIASARLRSLIPRDILTRQGLVKPGTDVIVAAKHGWDVKMVRNAARRMVMDVCDDHFNGHYRSHYIHACAVADEITCNSVVMRDIIEDKTGRAATVIDEPYEDDERQPDGGDGVLWFGHRSNLPDLEAISAQIHHPLTVISNHNWSPQALDRALKRCRCVVIPTGKSMAKSANRAIKAIRYGKYPVCGHMPSHAELNLGTRDIGELLDAAMENDFSDRVLALQDAIRDRFHPEKIAKDWLQVLRAA